MEKRICGMGVSSSLFMCGCKVYKRKTNNSTKPLIANGSAFSSDQYFLEKRHSFIGRGKKPKKKLGGIKCNLFNCCLKNKQNTASPCFQVMETQDDTQDNVMITSTNSNLQVGSMRITKPQFKALLVFAKKHDLCQAWQAALDKFGFQANVEFSEECALENFQRNQHHLVVIENQQEVFDAESLCRSLRGTYVGTFTTVIAVMCRRNEADESSSTRNMLHAGFDRLLKSTTNLAEIEDEILQLEAGPLTLQLKYRSCQVVFAALEQSRDLVQIADENYVIQYVNKTHERITGIPSKQVIGSELSSYFENEKNEEDTWEKIRDEIQNGKEYEGYFYTRRRLDEDIRVYVHVLPITRQDRSVHQYVVVSQLPENNSIIPDLTQIIGTKRINSYEPLRKHSGTSEASQPRRGSAASLYVEGDPHRRTNSLAKIHSMAVEAPITQIINLISVIKDRSQPPVSEILDQILDILRNSELYSPADLPNRSRDPMLSDFVEGLVTGTGFSHRRASGGNSEHLLGKAPPCGMKSSSSPGGQLASVMNADPQIARCLENLNSWDYNVLALERVTAKKALVHLGMHILNQFNTCDVLSCTPTTLHSWLVAIESNYHSSNPYHNSTHAADVLHATAYFLKKERVKTWMEPLDEVASLLAAIIHDVDHPGRTNAFLVNSNNPLALLYNDTRLVHYHFPAGKIIPFMLIQMPSQRRKGPILLAGSYVTKAVLESHHAAFAFKFTVNSDTCNIFKNMSKDNFRNMRQSIIDMVLATELSKHFEHVNKFISIVTKNNNNSSLEQECTATAGNRASAISNPVVTHELKTLVKRVMIKVADVINPARKTPLCVEWARRISEEYFTQTDEEKRLGLPVVMPHFDRNTCSMPKSQITFIDYFLADMFEAWHEFCGMEDAMSNLNENYNYWQKLQNKGVMRLAELEDESFTDEEENDDDSNTDSALSGPINATWQLGNHLS